jgi:hypothetical protein
VVGAISGAVAGMAVLGGAMNHANTSKMSGTVSVNGNEIDLSKVEAASKQLEAAAASANANGSDVKLVSSDVLKSLLPGSVAGYSRTEVESSSGGAGGMQMAVVKGDYDKNGTRFSLAVTDLGAMAGMAAMASAINAQSSRETATGYEKVGKVDGRMVTEEWDREAKSGKYTVLVPTASRSRPAATPRASTSSNRPWPRSIPAGWKPWRSRRRGRRQPPLITRRARGAMRVSSS